MYATFDGEVFRPEGPIPLEPNTRVRLTIGEEPAVTKKMGEPGCFFRAALAANIDGPPDWSERLDEYLYGEAPRSGD
jgi:hypothetical protein